MSLLGLFPDLHWLVGRTSVPTEESGTMSGHSSSDTLPLTTVFPHDTLELIEWIGETRSQESKQFSLLTVEYPHKHSYIYVHTHMYTHTHTHPHTHTSLHRKLFVSSHGPRHFPVSTTVRESVTDSPGLSFSSCWLPTSTSINNLCMTYGP